ncbi:4-(cytidine 5'-diphospho)-2-C-methyl-D-erythritol kinase, partial [Francisella tularensis subsp. holarctica]|uniref:4-(cytidine 5'-diphospho)-2-C-methyl-D-erythritol kinase n=1 Tax=Francisella tularensis TaxID=263 RepID=UPI0023ADCED4|nr:4-(cytidine 5'-diphospho)-2-C-methyl-D-erythritol kinase [Francisella tularensis subsp. holarctica]
MKAKKYYSYAKINLLLHKLNKRTDGYHNLQTWFTFLDLIDQLTFSFNNSREINISSNISIAANQDNLVYKAIKKFQQSYRVQDIGFDIEIKKHIPMGAGLGGG